MTQVSGQIVPSMVGEIDSLLRLGSPGLLSNNYLYFPRRIKAAQQPPITPPNSFFARRYTILRNAGQDARALACTKGCLSWLLSLGPAGPCPQTALVAPRQTLDNGGTSSAQVSTQAALCL